MQKGIMVVVKTTHLTTTKVPQQLKVGTHNNNIIVTCVIVMTTPAICVPNLQLQQRGDLHYLRQAGALSVHSILEAVATNVLHMYYAKIAKVYTELGFAHKRKPLVETKEILVKVIHDIKKSRGGK